MTPDELVEWDEGFDWEDLPRDVFFVDVMVSANEKFDERHEVVSIRYPPDGTVDPFVIHLKSGPGDLFSVSTMGLTGSSECGPGRAEFPAAESANLRHHFVLPLAQHTQVVPLLGSVQPPAAAFGVGALRDRQRVAGEIDPDFDRASLPEQSRTDANCGGVHPQMCHVRRILLTDRSNRERDRQTQQRDELARARA